MKYLITILSGFILAGCVSMPKVTQPKYNKISIPELNKPTSTYLGEKLLTQAEGMFTKSIILGEAEGANSKIFGGKFCNFNPNENTYISNSSTAVGNKSLYGQIVGYSSFVTYHEEENKVCANAISCYDSSEISIEFKNNDLCIAPNSFERVIEYNGKSGDVLNFTYREFSNNIARQAFTTDFTVDLTESSTFRYKGASIEVLEATNNKIDYIVLKNFNAN